MIRVVVDDLAFLPVDAVLRAADETLEPVTPAMSRLDRQAGERFDAQRKVSSPLDPGAAVVTGAGELAASFVLHVVVQSAERGLSAATVRRGLLSAWQQAAAWALGTVAAPLIGAGAGQLGVEEAARLLVETFPGGAGSDTHPSELIIVLERDTEREIVEAVVRSRRA